MAVCFVLDEKKRIMVSEPFDRKECIMKRKTAVVLLGSLTILTAFSGCGNNEATEAASESAQTEDEGTGDDAEMQAALEEEEEQKEKEEEKETKKDTEETKEAEEEEATSEAEESEEEDSNQVAVLFPDENNWADDAYELEQNLAEDGYEPMVFYAEGDGSKQVSQIQEMLAAEVKAFIIAPVDPYGLTDALAPVKEAKIPVFSYDQLIMDTNAVKYYTTFGGRQAGNMIAEEIIEKEELEKLREEKGTKTIEFLMGSLDNTQALFLYNGVMEILQPYLDDGTLVCTSGKVSFDDTGILRWSRESAETRLREILENSYEEGKQPDIICTGFDQAALAAVEVLEERGVVPGSEMWPMITGVECEPEAVKAVASGKISFSLFMDYRLLADACEQMVHQCLNGEEDPEVNDYEQYDNGVKIIGTYLCEPQIIDGDNYEILIDNGYYDEEEIRPEATPTPTLEPTSTPVPDPTVTPEPTEEPESEEETEPTPTQKPRITLRGSK